MLKATIYVVWLIFWIYWLVAASNSKKSKYRPKRTVLARLLIILATIVLLTQLGNTSDFNSPHTFTLRVIGTLLFFTGLILAVWARKDLGRNWGMPMSLKEKPELVTNGIYGVIRHPIYSGILLANLGTALAISYLWFVVLIVIGSYFIYSAFVEEKNIAKQFPDEYAAYKKRTKMLIPYLF